MKCAKNHKTDLDEKKSIPARCIKCGFMVLPLLNTAQKKSEKLNKKVGTVLVQQTTKSWKKVNSTKIRLIVKRYKNMS